MSFLENRVLTSSWFGGLITGMVSEGCPQGRVLLLRIKAVGYPDAIAILAKDAIMVLVNLIQVVLKLTDRLKSHQKMQLELLAIQCQNAIIISCKCSRVIGRK